MKLAFRIHLGATDITDSFQQVNRSETLWGTSTGYLQDPNGTTILNPYRQRMFSYTNRDIINRAKNFTNIVLHRYANDINNGTVLFTSITTTTTQELEYDSERLTDYSPQMVSQYRAWYQTNYGSDPGSAPQEFNSVNGKRWYKFRHKILNDFSDQMILSIKSWFPNLKYITDYGSVLNAATRRGTIGFKSLGQYADGFKVNDANLFDHRWSMDLLRSNYANKWIMNEVGEDYTSGDFANVITLITQSYQHGAKLVSVMNPGLSGLQSHASETNTIATNYLTGNNGVMPSTIAISGSLSYTVEEAIGANDNTHNNLTTNNRNIYQEWLNTYNSNPSNAKAVNVSLDESFLGGGNSPNVSTQIVYGYDDAGNRILRNPTNTYIPTTPICPSFNALSNNYYPAAGSQFRLTANCDGDCSGIGYTWSGNGVSGSGSYIDITAPFVSGTYAYYVKFTKAGCPDINFSVNIAVGGIVGCPTLSSTANNYNPSAGSAVRLDASCSGDCGGAGYTWSGNGINGTNSYIDINAPSAAGTYSYNVKLTKAGCADVNSTVSITVGSSVPGPQDGCYTLRVAGNTELLTNKGNQYPKVEPASGSNAQIWKLEASGGYVRLVADNGQILGVNNGGNSVDNGIVLMASGSQDYQLWSSMVVPGSSPSANVFVRKGSDLMMGSSLANGHGSSDANQTDVSLQSAPGYYYGANKWVMTGATCPGTTLPSCPTLSSSANYPNPSAGSAVRLSASCNGDCSGVGYTWSGNGINSTNSYIDINTPSTAGTYYYTVTATSSGCSVNSTVSITVGSSVPEEGCYTLRVAADHVNKLLTNKGNQYPKVEPASGNSSQIWLLQASGSHVRIMANNGQVLGVESGGNSVNSGILLMASGSQDHQLWTRTTLSGSSQGMTAFIRKGSDLLIGSSLEAGLGSSNANQTDITLQSDPGNIWGVNKWILTSVGCPGTTSTQARIGGWPMEEGLEVSEIKSDLMVAPNPSSGEFEATFYLEQDKTAILSVINDKGITYYIKNLKGNGNHIEKISLTNVAPGTYVVQLKKQGASEVKRIVIIH